MKYPEAQKIKDILDGAKTVVIIQADNPDGDSLASSLALEQILGDLGKEPHMYCSVDMPDYLKHLPGWDRVSKDIPSKLDASIIVDTSAILLLEKLEASEYRGWVSTKPVMVLDHHAEVVCDIPYAKVVINDADSVATGEVIYHLAKQLDWPLNLMAKTHIASSILADSLGLNSEGTTPTTYRIMADLIEAGVDRPALEEARRALSKMPEQIFRYKAELIKRTELHAEDQLALVTIPNDEIMRYSPLYNPAPLIQNDMLQTDGVRVAIVLKQYKDGKTTGAIRCGYNTKIAADLAKHFGGGGHVYASGFKVEKGKSFDQIKSECIKIASELLSKSNSK
ncbi:MAG TPA: DHH family phosphoesterase [Patescibacteria group bacterium]|nr:DHH family phosphoesterase [Patescibacteria group bacterium]